LPYWLLLGPELGSHSKLDFHTHSSSSVPGLNQHTREATEDKVSILFHRGFSDWEESNTNENNANFYFISKCSVKLIYFLEK